MQGMGLTDGIYGRYLSANRSELLPGLARMRQQSNSNAERNSLLHGRLEELLVFEIVKDSGAGYHRFNVRSLHKYVLNAIRNGAIDYGVKADLEVRSNRRLVDKLALGRAIINSSPNQIPDTNQTQPDSLKSPGATELGPINETEPLEPLEAPIVPPKPNHNEEEGGGHVTYRERLGAFLHPRDMRKLVTPFSASNEPELIVRRHAMLLNFDPLRAIILRDRLLVLVPDGADSILVELEKRIRGESVSMSTNYEHGSTMSEGNSVGKEESNLTTSDSAGDLGKLDVGDPDIVVDVDGVARSFDKSFIDNEWDELEGKDWIDLPFELQSVDAVLHCACEILADDVLDLQVVANSMIAELLNPKAAVGDHAQEVLRTMKNSVKETMSRVEGFCRAIDTLLEDYEDMALMNLSRLLTHPDRFVQPVPQAVLEEESDEPELILEAHLQQGHTLANALTLVEGQIDTTEDFAVRKSDTVRNRLLYINMVISVLTLAVGIGSFVGSLFGMNTVNHYENDTEAFRIIVLSTIFGGIGFVFLILTVIRMVGALPNVF